MNPDPEALKETQRALILLDEKIEESDDGIISGMDVVSTGVRAMASALAHLFGFPRAKNDKAPALDEVVGFLASEGQIEEGVVQLAAELQTLLRRARYTGLSLDEVEAAEDCRSELYGHLEGLLMEAEEELDRA